MIFNRISPLLLVHACVVDVTARLDAGSPGELDPDGQCMDSQGELDAKTSSLLQNSKVTRKVVDPVLSDTAHKDEAGVGPGTHAGPHVSPAAAGTRRKRQRHINEASSQARATARQTPMVSATIGQATRRQGIHKASMKPKGATQEASVAPAMPRMAINPISAREKLPTTPMGAVAGVEEATRAQAAPVSAKFEDAVRQAQGAPVPPGGMVGQALAAEDLVPTSSATAAAMEQAPAARASTIAVTRDEMADATSQQLKRSTEFNAGDTLIHKQPKGQDGKGQAPEALVETPKVEPNPSASLSEAADRASSTTASARLLLQLNETVLHAQTHTASSSLRAASPMLMATLTVVGFVLLVCIGVACSIEMISHWRNGGKQAEEKHVAKGGNMQTPQLSAHALHSPWQTPYQKASLPSTQDPLTAWRPSTPPAQTTPFGSQKDTMKPVGVILCPDLVVPAASECVLLVSRLVDPGSHVQLTIDDAGRIPVFQVTFRGLILFLGRRVDQPCSQKGRMVLSSASDGTTFAYCQVEEVDMGDPQLTNSPRRMISLTIHDSSSQPFGSLRWHRSQAGPEFQLTTFTNETVDFHVRAGSDLTAMDKHGRLLAVAEQMAEEPGRSIVHIGPFADVGLMIMCILGADLLKHLTLKIEAEPQSAVFRPRETPRDNKPTM